MKTRHAMPALVVMSAMLGGCSAIGTIFKAGAWTGVVLVLVAVAVIGGIAALARRG